MSAELRLRYSPYYSPVVNDWGVIDLALPIKGIDFGSKRLKVGAVLYSVEMKVKIASPP